MPADRSCPIASSARRKISASFRLYLFRLELETFPLGSTLNNILRFWYHLFLNPHLVYLSSTDNHNFGKIGMFSSGKIWNIEWIEPNGKFIPSSCAM
jgi:hypothetical protein